MKPVRLFVCAILRPGNLGILIGSFLRGSCGSNFNLLPEQTVFHTREYSEVTAMASNITSVSKREKVISL